MPDQPLTPDDVAALSPADARAAFARLLAHRVTVRAELAAIRGPQHDAWMVRNDAWRKAESKRRKKAKEPPLADLAADDLWQAMPADLRADGDALVAAYKNAEALLDVIRKGLDALAPAVVIDLDGDTDRILAWGATYPNQTDSTGYNRGSAEAYADVARMAGVPVHVVALCYWSPDCGGWRQDKYGRQQVNEGTYAAVVRVVSDLDVEVLQRRPGPSLVEWVRLCWKRGRNPRVYNPWLPHGFEDAHGLDYFGNYKAGHGQVAS
jgi:hypothetical protein